ncbi:MAG: hypothetical protein JWM78_648 [Verrucomicrobiaceae bacterium]|nr:hypothetical protein [Verrucomicrobiaceae bacterium]
MHQSTTNPLEHLIPDLKQHSALPYRELILCRFCHAAITTQREELQIDRQHQHRFMNPSGAQFLIGCFKLAPGCDIAGAATGEYTWFKEHTWQFARCSDCGEHLGWFYQKAEDHQFFGLIIEKLVRYQS